MIINRLMKGSTHIGHALKSADSMLGVRDVAKIARELKQTDAFVQINIYHDGWVPKSYKWRSVGTRTIIRIEGCGYRIIRTNYDRRRSHGYGPLMTAFAGSAEQSQGRRVWGL